MLQQDKSDNYVLVSGVTVKVRDFVKKSFLDFEVEVNLECYNKKKLRKW